MRGVRLSQDLIDEYVTKGYWDGTTMVDIYEKNAKDYPGKEAVVDSKTRLTWSQVKQRSDRIALRLLELGIKRDQIGLVQLPNIVDAFVLQVALRKIGVPNGLAIPVFRHKEIGHVLQALDAVGVFIPWRYRDFDYFQMIQDLKPKLAKLEHIFVVGDDVPQGALSVSGMYQQPLEEKYPADYLHRYKIDAYDTSVVLLTSGTTGVPKMIEWSEAACVCGGRGILEKLKATEKDTFGGVMPMSGASGYLSIWLAPPQVAARTVLLEAWEPGAALKLIEKERITTLIAAPPQMGQMLQHPDFGKADLRSLRAIRSGGGPLKPALGAELEKKIGCRMAVSSGSTETGVLGSTAVDDPDDIRLYTLGRPITGMELKVIDDEGKELPPGEPGELLARGCAASSGYYKDPKATAEVWATLGKDGWFQTGDIAVLDKEGNLKIIGRKKDMILRGGQNIFPKEIEDALGKHPKILDAAVVAMPDPIMGEKACAYVTLNPGQKLPFEEMVLFLQETGLSTYTLPERLEVIDSLPIITYTGKVDKKALREDITNKLKAERKSNRSKN